MYGKNDINISILTSAVKKSSGDTQDKIQNRRVWNIYYPTKERSYQQSAYDLILEKFHLKAYDVILEK